MGHHGSFRRKTLHTIIPYVSNHRGSMTIPQARFVHWLSMGQNQTFLRTVYRVGFQQQTGTTGGTTCAQADGFCIHTLQFVVKPFDGQTLEAWFITAHWRRVFAGSKPRGLGQRPLSLKRKHRNWWFPLPFWFKVKCHLASHAWLLSPASPPGARPQAERVGLDSRVFEAMSFPWKGEVVAWGSFNVYPVWKPAILIGAVLRQSRLEHSVPKTELDSCLKLVGLVCVADCF